MAEDEARFPQTRLCGKTLEKEHFTPKPGETNIGQLVDQLLD
jgi:hypothetical protein